MKGKKVLNATIVDKYNMCKVFSYLDIKIFKFINFKDMQAVGCLS